MTSIHANHVTDAPPHILVMKDEESVARGLEMVLEEEGYDVDLAYT
ncbi:MAG: response regulator transcription factor, partial [Desulfobacterales bacterium]|nr:response regulator transcription factor [Desulfobacterales bacterium]